MADRQTGSVWTHLEGVAIQGPLEGRRLEVIPLIPTTWAEWTALHPETMVLDNNTRFFRQYRPVFIGQPGIGAQFAQSLLYWDPRLPENEVVIGVTQGEESRAYVLEAMPSGLGAVNDTLGEIPIVLLHHRENAFGIAYDRRVAGELLTFTASDGRIIDEQTGSAWSVEGRAIEGPLDGQRLSFVTSFITEWYGWAAFHPETEIYEQEAAQASVGAGTDAPTSRSQAGGPPRQTSWVQCLIDRIGDKAFSEVSAGLRPPTPQERAASQACG